LPTSQRSPLSFHSGFKWIFLVFHRIRKGKSPCRNAAHTFGGRKSGKSFRRKHSQQIGIISSAPLSSGHSLVWWKGPDHSICSSLDFYTDPFQITDISAKFPEGHL